MPIVLQLLAIVASVSMVIITIMGFRLMRRLEVLTMAATQSLARFDAFLDQSQKSSVRIEGILVSLEGMTGSVRHSVETLDVVVQRSAGMASSVLDQVERPVQNVLAVIRGVQVAATYLLKRRTGRAVTSNAGSVS